MTTKGKGNSKSKCNYKCKSNRRSFDYVPFGHFAQDDIIFLICSR